MVNMDRILMCVLVGFAISLAISPVVVGLMRKLKANQTIYEFVDMHKSKANTPTMGGLIFIIGAIASSVLCFKGNSSLAIVCVVCFLCFGIIGFLDDFLKIYFKHNLGLKPYQKIIGQLAISVIIAVFAYKNAGIGSQIYLPFTNRLVDLGWFYIPFCIFVFLATTNSVNLTDGLDGLAGGVSTSFLFGFVGATFILIKSLNIADPVFLKEQMNILVLCGGVIGSLFAYLIFNCYPANIFMGDTGSLALGGLVASISICTKQVLLIPILGIMFVISAVSVIIQVVWYKLTKKRIFLMAPFHHHLEKKGVNETRIVVIYIVVTLIVSVATIWIYGLANL